MKADRLPVQAREYVWNRLRIDGAASVPRELAEAAWEGYDADGHGSQSCARLHERGGFGLAEMAYYLARAVDEGRVRIEILS